MVEEGRHFVCRHCGAYAWICTYCDRGHAYCSPSCRQLARRRITDEARRRYQATSAGQSGNARRQREWYRRKQEKLGILTHQGSTDPGTFTIISPAPSEAVAVLEESASAESRETVDPAYLATRASDHSSGAHRCIVCGVSS